MLDRLVVSTPFTTSEPSNVPLIERDKLPPTWCQTQPNHGALPATTAARTYLFGTICRTRADLTDRENVGEAVADPDIRAAV